MIHWRGENAFVKMKIAVPMAFVAGLVVGIAIFAILPIKRVPRTARVSDECKWPAELDAVIAAPKNHKVLLENRLMRVLDVNIPPGEQEPVHAHCLSSALIVLKGGRAGDYDAQGRIIDEGPVLPDGSSAPYAFWLDSTPPHSVHNLDNIPIHLIRVELKPHP
jgi:hypothetical protein